MVGGHTAAILRCVVSRTCSIPLKAFFSTHLVSVHVVHPYITIDTTAAWKKTVLFYRSDLTSIWPIAYLKLSMPLLVVCWCHSRLMRCCFWCRWTCSLVSKARPLGWRCRLFDQTIFIAIENAFYFTVLLYSQYFCCFNDNKNINSKVQRLCMLNVTGVTGNGIDDPSSNPRRGCLRFTSR